MLRDRSVSGHALPACLPACACVRSPPDTAGCQAPVPMANAGPSVCPPRSSRVPDQHASSARMRACSRQAEPAHSAHAPGPPPPAHPAASAAPRAPLLHPRLFAGARRPQREGHSHLPLHVNAPQPSWRQRELGGTWRTGRAQGLRPPNPAPLQVDTPLQARCRPPPCAAALSRCQQAPTVCRLFSLRTAFFAPIFACPVCC